MTPLRSRRAGAAARGFTLLEVLVAISILGLGLTAILSAQTGLFASSTRTERNSFAIGLLRCKMNEVELDMLKKGFSLVDESDQGPCCEDEGEAGFSCEWALERIELPQPVDLETMATDENGLGDVGALGSGTSSNLGSLGAISAVGQSGGAILGDKADLGSVAELLGGAAAGGTQSLAPLLMSLVYPSLKPMLEASIRRVTVTVRWKEGNIDRDLSATQFLTNPQQGGFDPMAAEGLDTAMQGLLGQTVTATGFGTTGTGTGTGK
jgi:general secretion pathway protein I